MLFGDRRGERGTLSGQSRARQQQEGNFVKTEAQTRV